MSTVVFCHAHPDDEVLLTGGTIAMLAAAGHRVVVVTATAGEAGLAERHDPPGGLGVRRRGELDQSTRILGASAVTVLGYADSGMTGPLPPGAFAAADRDEAAARLAEVLQRERADVVVGYDEAGGYGHRDHVQVHHVVRRAARLAGTPTLLEATVDRRALGRVLRLLRLTGRTRGLVPPRIDAIFADPATITHRIDVRPFLAAKRAAMQAHASQATGGDNVRTLALLLRLPAPVFRLAVGREWFTEVGRPAPRRPAARLPVGPA